MFLWKSLGRGSGFASPRGPTAPDRPAPAPEASVASRDAKPDENGRPT